MSTGPELDIDFDDLRELYKEKGPDAAKKIREAQLQSPVVPVVPPTPDGREGRVRRRPGPVVASSPAVYTPVALSESENYGARTGKGDVIARYNCKDSSEWLEPLSHTLWSVGLVPGTGVKSLAERKIMYQKPRDMAMAMNAAVHELGMILMSENDLDGYGDLRESTPEDENAVYIGRIRGSGNGKLSLSDITFEGTLESSRGHVVSLDLSAESLNDYFFYPGQVVALKGNVSMGKVLHVKSVQLPEPLPFSDSPIDISRTTGPLDILVAAAPFTPNDSLSYEALKDLKEEILKFKPGLVILFGPFFDEVHPKLDEFIEKQDNLFEDFFRKKIQELCDLSLPGTQFVIVASNRDEHHFPVFPTMPYDLSNKEGSIIKIKQEKVIAVPDPCTLSVNGLIIGLTSTDILMHVQKNILAKATISKDRFSAIAMELMRQRNFYPLYPPDRTVPMDVSLWTEYAHMTVKPHVLILPSDLNPFFKDVEKTVVLNPGRLAAGKRTFARLQIQFPADATDATTSVADYAMGEIIKI